jgi:hypothetical protein
MFQDVPLGNAIADFLIATTQLVYRLAVGAGFSNPLIFAGAFGWAVNEKRPASEKKLAMANDIRETNPLRRCPLGMSLWMPQPPQKILRNKSRTK